MARQCPDCGGESIVPNVRMSQTVETGAMGLTYRAMGILNGTEPVLADLCGDCGTLVRLHVLEPKRKWVQK
jgi:hypothetical protein